jgi:uncharacterized RDD family membrane protein YckC
LTCPACGAGAAVDQTRCPACGASFALPIEGALAPDPLAIAPPARGKPEPMRDLPGAKKKERTWKDEVNDRVKDRKRRRQGKTNADLPLFETVEEERSETNESPGDLGFRLAAEQGASAFGPDTAPFERGLDDGLRAQVGDVLDAGRLLPDLPLRPAEESAPSLLPETPAPPPRPLELAEDSAERPADDDWRLELKPAPPAATPVERPAWLGERLRAGVVDLALLAGLWAVVVYFAGRTAHVPIRALFASWPYLAAYLAFLGLAYAGYFTGTTGQSVGKILFGLRVVDTGGRPPGYLRAFARAALGAVSVVVLAAGFVPMAFDPARRTVHDRLFRTRVIKG